MDDLHKIRERALDLSRDPRELEKEELKDLLARLDDQICEHLIYKGRVLAALAEKGVLIRQDFHYIVLQRVGDGSVIPEVYLRFQHKVGVMKRLSMLPLAEQKRLVDGDPIEVADLSHDGINTRMVPVNEIDGKLSRQVFEGCRIRTPEQQARWLKKQEAKLRHEESDPRVVHRGRGVELNGHFTKKELLKIAATM